MPVDRRFEMPEPKNDRTDLEVWLRVKGPDFLRRNVGNILLGLAVLIAAAFFLYNLRQGKRAEAVAVQQNAAAAYDFSTQLRSSIASAGTSDGIARDRQQRARDAITSADVVIGSEAATPAQRAIALLAKADVYWALANAKPGSLATSQPVASFAVKPPEGFLDDAEAAYTEILRSYADESEPVASALLSLAAIAENRGKFDDAAQWYRRAIDEKTLRPAYHDIARERLAMLDELRKPLTLAASTTQPTAPMIFRDRPTTGAATLPASPDAELLVPSTPTTAPTATAPAATPAPATAPATTQP